MVYSFMSTQNLVIAHCCFAEDVKKMYQELQRTCIAIVLLIKPFCLATLLLWFS